VSAVASFLCQKRAARAVIPFYRHLAMSGFPTDVYIGPGDTESKTIPLGWRRMGDFLEEMTLYLCDA
jgi:hypothetical protein